MSKDQDPAEFEAIVQRLEAYVSNIRENVPVNPEHKLQEINFFLANIKQDEKSKKENEEQDEQYKTQKQTPKLPQELKNMEQELINLGLKTNDKGKFSKVTELRSLAEELAGQHNLIYSTALKNKDVLLAWFKLNWDIIKDHIQETLQKMNKDEKS